MEKETKTAPTLFIAMKMFDKLRSRLGRKKARSKEDVASDDERWPEHSLGARRGETSDVVGDDGNDDFRLAEFDGELLYIMASFFVV